MYLLKINKLELIIDNTNKICFLYKGNKIKTDDMNKDVSQFFTSDYEQNIVVNDPNNLIGNYKDYLNKCDILFDIFYKERGNYTGSNTKDNNNPPKIEVRVQNEKYFGGEDSKNGRANK